MQIIIDSCARSVELCNKPQAVRRCGEDDICLHPHRTIFSSASLHCRPPPVPGQSLGQAPPRCVHSRGVGSRYKTRRHLMLPRQAPSGSGPLIEYTSLDKLGYRCKDDLSSVSAVTRPLLDSARHRGPAPAAVINMISYRSASHTIKQKLGMLTINLSNKNTKMGPSKTNTLRSYA